MRDYYGKRSNENEKEEEKKKEVKRGDKKISDGQLPHTKLNTREKKKCS